MPHKRKLAKRICIICGNLFWAIHFGGRIYTKTCSTKCLKIARTRSLKKLPRRGPTNNKWIGGPPHWTCGQCGKKFQAYFKKKGKPRLYCSWVCANQNREERHHIHPSIEGIEEMRARLRFENELMAFLEDRGYCCLRSAGSRGPFDLFAFSERQLRLIQVKSTYDLKRKRNNKQWTDAILKMRTVPSPPNSTKELWVKPLRKSWLYLIDENLPETRGELLVEMRDPKWVEA
jgi:Holliday junction resolvase